MYYGWGRMFIGGDNLVPFYAEPLDRYLYQWIDQKNGLYVSGNYFPLKLSYFLLEKFTSDIYKKVAFFIIALRVVGAVGIYFLLRLIYKAKLGSLVVFSIVFYLLAPIYFNGHLYLVIYYIIPLLLYFPLKIVQNKKVSWFDILAVNALVFFGSLDLPNPKYLFYSILMIGVIIGMGCISRILDRKFFIQNKFRLLLAILVSSYILIPQTVFVASYNPSDYGIGVKKNYSNKADIAMMDFGSSTGGQMVRLHHDGLNLFHGLKVSYLENPAVIFASYSFIILIAFYFIKNREKTFFDYTVMVLIVFFLLLSIGPNPPLGFIYEFLVTSFGPLGFLRTTAGSVFFVALFYSLILYRAQEFFNKRLLNIGLWVCFGLVSYPILTGDYFKSWSPVNQYTDRTKHGLIIPDAYFDLKTTLQTKKLDSRVYVPGGDPAYINTKWGYFGPFTFYRYLFKSDIQDEGWLFNKPSRQSIGYVINDKSLMRAREPALGLAEDELYLIQKNDFLDLYGTNLNNFVPRVYSFSRLFFSDHSDDLEATTPVIRIGLENKKYFKQPLISPKIEFKRINSSKYKIVFHNVVGDFLVVVSEAFNDQWKLFLGDYKSEKQSLASLNALHNKYKILRNNANEQANINELSGFLDNGLITTLGDSKIKYTNHYKYTSKDRILNEVELHHVEFISKQFFGTIQNNNLLSELQGVEIELSPQIAQHLKADSFANSWLIKTDYIEKTYANRIVKNPDGSFDFIVTAEFMPARYLRVSVIFSLAIIFAVVVCWIFELVLSRRKKLI